MWNPLEWLKLVYEAIGHKYPFASALVTVSVFAVLGLAVWWRVDSQYRKDHPSVSQNEPARTEKGTPANTSTPPNAEYESKIILTNADGMELLIYPSNGRYLCKILNGSPSVIRHYQINVSSSRTFDAVRLIWSDPIQFRGLMGPSEATNPRDFTREFNFAVPAGSGLRIGDSAESILKWPTGDPNPIHRWRIAIKVLWTSGTARGEWPIDLCFRRDPSTNTLEFMEFRESIPLAYF